MVFDEVQTDLEAAGYEVIPVILPACSLNAPHRRDRVWFIAHAEGLRNSRELRGLEKENGSIRESEKYGQNDLQFSNDGSFRNVAHQKLNNGSGSVLRALTNANRSGLQTEGSEQQAAGIEQYGKLGREDATNAASEGLEGRFGQSSQGDSNGFTDGSKECNASNANSFGLRRKANGLRETRQPDQKSKGSNWKNFPTQPPICSRDDGFSAELDGITFPKWRAESIKAYGNAIVPQVAFEIFKVINQLESINHDR